MSKTGLKLQLAGQDGNAFAILGKAKKAMKQAGCAEAAIKKYMEEATSGNYDHLLQVTMEWFDVRRLFCQNQSKWEEKMTQQQSETYLNQYHNLIRKAAWQTSRDIGADFEDALGEAYLIFCEAIEKYDETYGAKFGTYLTHCLRDLKRRVFVCWKNYVELDEIPEVEGYNMSNHIQANALFLDEDAKTLLDALMLGRFDINGTKLGGRQNPGFQTVYRVMRQHNWTWSRCLRGWNSLKQWWSEN